MYTGIVYKEVDLSDIVKMQAVVNGSICSIDIDKHAYGNRSLKLQNKNITTRSFTK